MKRRNKKGRTRLLLGWWRRRFIVDRRESIAEAGMPGRV